MFEIESNLEFRQSSWIPLGIFQIYNSKLLERCPLDERIVCGFTAAALQATSPLLASAAVFKSRITENTKVGIAKFPIHTHTCFLDRPKIIYINVLYMLGWKIITLTNGLGFLFSPTPYSPLGVL